MGKAVKNVVVLGVDPGLSGAFVVFDGADLFEYYPMPLVTSGKYKQVDFFGVRDLLQKLSGRYQGMHVFLERAFAMGMGVSGAFSYGRGFEALVIAIALNKLPVTQVEPSKWTREMHEGLSQDLKAKARSQQAVVRLFPQLVGKLPRRPKGGVDEGPMDALLIAAFGLRRMKGEVGKAKVTSDDVGDFY